MIIIMMLLLMMISISRIGMQRQCRQRTIRLLRLRQKFKPRPQLQQLRQQLTTMLLTSKLQLIHMIIRINKFNQKTILLFIITNTTTTI